MKYTVTGADGFIGCNMVAFLKDKGHEVKAVIFKENDLTRAQYEKADDVVEADLLDLSQTFEALDHGDVFHFAANMGGVGFFSENDYRPFIENMTMDLNVFRVCEANGHKLFYPSSACAYPVGKQQVEGRAPLLTEGMLIPANADQMYGWEKLMMILLAEKAPFDCRVGILNTVFGEYQTWEGERAKFPPSIVAKVIQSKRSVAEPITIWGNGRQIRTFLYIQDALEKIYEVMTATNYWGAVNIASDRMVTVQQCADWCLEIAGIKRKFNYDSSRPSGVLARGVDNTKFNLCYSYREKYTVKEGFERLYKWMEPLI